MLKTATRTGTLLKILLCGFLSGTLAAPAFVSAQAPSIGLVVFGDSLSDPGNAFALLGGTNTPPGYAQDFFLVPDKPYARGGLHFSNGATWIEQFGRAQGLAENIQPAFRGTSLGATNYAIGAARARDDGSEFHLSRQVGHFLQEFGGAAPAGALYVIEIGGNDIRDVLATQNPALVAEALGAIQANIVALYAAGARKFLVWNAPKIAVTPAITKADGLFPGTAAAADGVTVLYNGALATLLENLQLALGDSRIMHFDAYSKVAAIHADGSAFGLTEVNAACISPDVEPFACQNPDAYMFWDGIHPTKAVHAIFAHEVMQFVTQ